VNPRRINPALAAVVCAAFALFSHAPAQAATRIAVLPAPGPGAGTGVVFVDALQQASPWIGVGDPVLELDAEGNLLGLRPGQSAERVVFTSERYPAGNYSLEWTGRATFAVSGGELLPTGRPNALILRVSGATGSGLLLRVTSTDPVTPVRNLHLYLPGYPSGAPKPVFTPELLGAMNGADIVRVNARNDGPTAADEATQNVIVLANVTGANPWISVPAGATNEEIAGQARRVLRTLDPSLHPVLDYGSRDMLKPHTPLNAWAVAGARALHIGVSDPQLAARLFYERRSAEALEIFRETFGAQAGRIVPAGSAEMLRLHRAAGSRGELGSMTQMREW